MDDENAVYIPKSPREREWFLSLLLKQLQERQALSEEARVVLINAVQKSIEKEGKAITLLPMKRGGRVASTRSRLKRIYWISNIFKNKSIPIIFSDITEDQLRDAKEEIKNLMEKHKFIKSDFEYWAAYMKNLAITGGTYKGEVKDYVEEINFSNPDIRAHFKAKIEN
jgi:hypothetical protein